jgi:hypothetical protein
LGLWLLLDLSSYVNLVNTHVQWVLGTDLDASSNSIKDHACIATHKLMIYLCSITQCEFWVIQSESRIDYKVYWRPPYQVDDVRVGGCEGHELQQYKIQF